MGNTKFGGRWRLVMASASLLGITNCAAEDWSEPIPDHAITEEEIVAGASDDGRDHVEPTEETDGEIPSDLAPDLPEVDLDGDSSTGTVVSEHTACRRATGYVRGRPISICVTIVDGKLLEVNTAAAYRRMQAAARRAGVSLRVVSGFRTMDQQRYLWNLYRSGRGAVAARPGYSNHQSGRALDLNTSSPGVYNWLVRHAAAYGFHRTVPSEPWHWERW